MDTQTLLRQKFDAKVSMQLAKSHLEKLNSRINEAYEKIEELNWILESSYLSLQKLENLSIKGLFQNILGSKEEQIEIERQEYLEAVLNYREAQESVKLLEFEKSVLEEKLEGLPSLLEEIELLILLREREILNSTLPLKRDIIYLNLEQDKCIQLKREVYEAKIAGTKVKVTLQKLTDDLRTMQKTESWGSMERSNTSRTSLIANINHYFVELKTQIYRFEDELADVYNHKNVNLTQELGKLPAMTVTFYSNLVSDWIFRDRIYHTLFQFEAIQDKVLRLLQSLDNETYKAESKIKQLEERKNELIIKGLDFSEQ